MSYRYNLCILYSDINWINTNITENKQQKQAVIKILHMTANPAPYIIFGPPGTGKTATLVEAICQVILHVVLMLIFDKMNYIFFLSSILIILL